MLHFPLLRIQVPRWQRKTYNTKLKHLFFLKKKHKCPRSPHGPAGLSCSSDETLELEVLMSTQTCFPPCPVWTLRISSRLHKQQARWRFPKWEAGISVGQGVEVAS